MSGIENLPAPNPEQEPSVPSIADITAEVQALTDSDEFRNPQFAWLRERSQELEDGSVVTVTHSDRTSTNNFAQVTQARMLGGNRKMIIRRWDIFNPGDASKQTVMNKRTIGGRQIDYGERRGFNDRDLVRLSKLVKAVELGLTVIEDDGEEYLDVANG